MDFLELIVFLLGGVLSGSIIIAAYISAVIGINHKDNVRKNIEEEN